MNDDEDKYFSNPISVQDYVLKIEDPLIAEYTEALINGALSILKTINIHYQIVIDDPIIRITDGLEPNARAITWIIEVTSGMIQSCIDTSFVPPEEILSPHTANAISYPHIHFATLSWMFAHEWIHVIMNHEGVQQELGKGTEVASALEFDADLCAITAIYRKFQAFKVPIEDDEIRKMVIYCIFWTLRTFPEPANHSIHAPMEDRLSNMVIKLASLAEQEGEDSDWQYKNPATAKRRDSLLDVFFKCESSFREKSNHPQAQYSLIERWHEKFNSGHFKKVFNKWQEIKEVVYAQSEIKTRELKELREESND